MVSQTETGEVKIQIQIQNKSCMQQTAMFIGRYSSAMIKHFRIFKASTPVPFGTWSFDCAPSLFLFEYTGHNYQTNIPSGTYDSDS